MKNKPILLILLISFLFSSCMYENQEFPSPEDVDVTTPISNDLLGSVIATVTSADTSYTISALTTDTIQNGANLLVLGLDSTTLDGIGFLILGKDIGIYSIENIPPSIPQGLFVFSKYNGTGNQTINMTHGNITITNKDATNKKIQGTFNVNNIGQGSNEYTLVGTFDVHWRE